MAVTRRQREREARKAAVMKAAEKVFLKRGLALATMEEIARSAQVSKGAIYLYFKNKDDLFLAIAVNSQEKLHERVQVAAEVGDTGLERLRNITRAHINFALENVSRFRVHYGWMFSPYELDRNVPHFEPFQGGVSRLMKQSCIAIQAGQEDGSIKTSLTADQIVLQLWSGCSGALHLQLKEKELPLRVENCHQVSTLAMSFLDFYCRGLSLADC